MMTQSDVHGDFVEPRPDRRRFLEFSAAGGVAAILQSHFAQTTNAASTEAVAAPTGSDVGSLFPFINSQAEHNHFPLSYINAEFTDLNAWKQRARAKVLDLIHYAPAACNPAAETVERADCGDYVRERVLVSTTPDLRIPAFVLVPKDAPGPLPAIVALHDHGAFYMWGKEKLVDMPAEHPQLAEFRQQYYGGKSVAVELVRQGYLVIVIDMFYWGERRMLLDDDPADWRERPASITADRIRAFNKRAGLSEPLVARTIYAAGFTWPGVIFWDDMRTIDYLGSRPDVDKNRIGCVGLSVGGFRACHLAALDDRIRAAVAVGWMTSFPWQLKHHINNTIGHTMVVPGLYQHLDYPDVVSMAAPTPLLVINGSRDHLFEPGGVTASFEKLQACYKKAGAPERFRARLYDAPHEFNAAMQDEAWGWLKRWL